MKWIRFIQYLENYRSQILGFGFILITWGVYFCYLWPKMLSWTEKGLRAGVVRVWADWAVHFSYAGVFAYRSFSDWFIGHPLYWDRKFTYPFAVDAVSGLLMRFCIDPVPAPLSFLQSLHAWHCWPGYMNCIITF